jgi:hypothetical protein
MPIPNMKVRPPPPRRAPPQAANLTQEVSAGTYTATHIKLQVGGVAATSQRLIKAKDTVNDIKVALATAEATVDRITTNPTLLGAAPGDSTRGGVDIQSLEFAASTRAKLGEQEQKQDSHYAKLRESATVAQEVQKAANDPALRRCREDVECQLATSTFPGARFPQRHGGMAGSMAPEQQQQVLLNPYTTVRRQSKNGTLTASTFPTTMATSSNNSSANSTTPYRPSVSSSVSGGGGATAPPETQVHAPTGVPSLYGSSMSTSNAGTSAPPSVAANGRYRPGPASSSSCMYQQPQQQQQPYGRTPGAQGGFGGGYAGAASAYPPTVTAATAVGGYPMTGNAGCYGASPYPTQGGPQPVYGQYGQVPPMANSQGNTLPTYTAL